MEKPAIITVGDDAEVLRAIERDSRRKYTADHRVLWADSGKAALEIVRELQIKNNAVAFFCC